MSRTKNPRAIYSALDEIAAEVLRIAQAPPEPPAFGGEAAGAPVPPSPASGPAGPDFGEEREASEVRAAPASPAARTLPASAVESVPAAPPAPQRLLGRRVEAQERCPGCGKDVLWRVQRDGWMRLLPGSRHFQCDACEARFLTCCGRTVRLT